MKKSKAARIITATAVALTTITLALVNVPPLTECRAEPPVTGKEYWSRAIEAVVQPWLGPHHVYGVFSVPVQYRRDRLYTAKLMIRGVTQDFPETSPEAGSVYGDRAETGHYIMRVHLPTRVALWFLLTGRFGDLQMPCHWWLIIEGRMR